jgi:hypothetical protein
MKNKNYIIYSILSIILMVSAFVLWYFIPNSITKGIGALAIFSALLFIFFGVTYIDESEG